MGRGQMALLIRRCLSRGGTGMGKNGPTLLLAEGQTVLLNRVTQLLDMAEEPFLQLVMGEAKGRADPITALALRHPDLRVCWLKGIKSRITELHRQFAQHKDDPEAAEWRKRANNVQASLLRRKYEAEAAGHRRTTESQWQRQRRLEASLDERRRRGELGEAAVQRLVEAHHEEFDTYLAEEYQRAGVELSGTLARRIAARIPHPR